MKYRVGLIRVGKRKKKKELQFIKDGLEWKEK